MSKNFTTSNPESLIYEHEILKITVLGGVKLEGLDRMRVTLKIELKACAEALEVSSVPPVRHNLDLYNDNQLEKLIRKGAERLEIGTSVLAATLAELTEQLEEYRLERIKETQPKPYESPKLTKQEHKEAESFLTQPNLLERTNELIGKSGVIGEENNRLLMYVIFTSRKRSQPLHVVSLAESGLGKTHLQESVASLMPDEDRIELTTLSENAFYYFGQQELKNKLILIEDLDGAENVLYPLRELQSKKKISKTIAHKNTNGETKTMHLVVEGPVSVAGCTTKEQIYEDNANRSFLIYLDDSKEQDDKIMAYQRRASAGIINTYEQEQIKILLQNTQRLLEPVKVVNPYAELLHIPSAVLKPRRTNNHYLQFIEAVTFYHQFQREKKQNKESKEEFIETTLEDIEQANKLMKTILLRKSDELSGACRNYFEELKVHLKENKQTEFTNREIRQAFRISGTTLRRYHNQLESTARITIIKGKKATGYTYQVTDEKEYKKLQSSIDTLLDEILKKVECATKPVVSQSKNGSLKTAKNKEKVSVSH